jgi:NodT family efflux transporter outer membrane factor (OMF) lipoprotein
MNCRELKIVALVTLLAGCAVGPDYKRPAVASPAAFKEANGWKQAEPRDEELKGPWWKAFKDPLLDGLIAQVDISNLTLVQAEAQFRQAQALAASARAGYYPTVNASVTTTRSRASSTTVSQPTPTPISRGVVTNHNLPVQASWEADVWGKIRRTVEANEASAQASAADLEAARLSARSTLAQDYFDLRSLDTQRQLLDDTLIAYRRALELTENQYKVGVVARSDVILAQVQLKTAEAQALDLGVQRAQLEHAIALLIGKAPSEFSIAPAPLAATPPAVPIGLPSQLLERRPDVAAAERRMAAANAQIGVAKAAYYPAFTLTGSTGYQSATLADWFTAPSRFWSLGAGLAGTLFDGGLRSAQGDAAIAAYDASVAVYRQTVLTGLQQVEDNLAALRILEEEARVQNEALQYARQSLAIAINQYKAGIVNYLNVVSAQATALSSEKTAVDLLNRRLAASVLLITALGGGWDVAMLPTNEDLVRKNDSSKK